MRLIDANELIEFFNSDNGLEELAEDLAIEHGLGNNIPEVLSMAEKLVEGFKNVIDTSPTIEAKQGHWINDKGLWKCSNCNTLETGFWASVVPIENMWKYCPHCGVKMDEVE